MAPTLDASAPTTLDDEQARIGMTIGRYRVTSLLGKGGMGVVYLAEDEALRREIALKVISSDVSENEERRARLLREARAAAAVSHPNIAAVYDVGEANHLLYMAMERVQGISLRERLSRGRLPIDEGLRIGKLVLEGLAMAHDAGIIHRDLKPENIMVNDAGLVKILDFGLAKFIEKEKKPAPPGTMITEEGRLLGTPSYMSPEQAAGLPVDARSDVFSFGIVFYEMLTGTLPFQGTNVLKILAAIERDEPIAPKIKNPDVPAHIEQLILQCLQKEPHARPEHAREVLRVFEAGSQGKLDKPNVAPPEKRKRTVPVLPLIGVLLAVILGMGFWNRKHVAAPLPNSSASTVAIAPPAPTPVTALPLSKTDSAEALAAYREGMQALRDSAWTAALTAFERAAREDPSFASAQLRIALTSLTAGDVPESGRVAFRKAVSLRTELSERDLMMLDALAFVYQRDPADMRSAWRKFRQASEKYPLDTEFLMIAHSIYFTNTISPQTRLRAAERCLELDPQYADCLQLKAWALEHLGRIDEAIAVYDHCATVSPASSDCFIEIMMLHLRGGNCRAMEVSARRVLTTDSDPRWNRNLGMALLARGEDLSVVQAVMAQGWEKAPEPLRQRLKRSDEIQFALLAGRMDEAEKGLLERWKRDKENRHEVAYSESSRQLIQFYHLMNRSKDAAEIADTYWRERPLLKKGLFYEDISMDRALFFLKQRADGGLLPRDTFVEERKRWFERWEPELDDDVRAFLWLRGHVELISTPEDAREALAAKPPDVKPVEFYGSFASVHHAALGEMYLLAGRAAEAIPHLERATGDCAAFMQPIANTMAYYQLGMARETTGNQKGACDSYRLVLERWGNAKPRVPLTEDVRNRTRTLQCEKKG